MKDTHSPQAVFGLRRQTAISSDESDFGSAQVPLQQPSSSLMLSMPFFAPEMTSTQAETITSLAASPEYYSCSYNHYYTPSSMISPISSVAPFSSLWGDELQLTPTYEDTLLLGSAMHMQTIPPQFAPQGFPFINVAPPSPPGEPFQPDLYRKFDLHQQHTQFHQKRNNENVSEAPAQSSTPSLSTSLNSYTPSQSIGVKRSSTSDRSNRRRASSQHSVAAIVSLTAHEPVAKVINGVAHISFLYSHDRQVKEYTVRTNIDDVSPDGIPVAFRAQNAIYPRANVERKDYGGNRWDYETACNNLGWQLSWINREQLHGKRGLIQRAVDSYRNHHAGMRSRRMTRQEMATKGTLRKRISRKMKLQAA